MQIALLLIEGMSAKQIGGQLGISTRTCEQYILAIYRKIDAVTRGECIAKLIKGDLLMGNAGIETGR